MTATKGVGVPGQAGSVRPCQRERTTHPGTERQDMTPAADQDRAEPGRRPGQPGKADDAPGGSEATGRSQAAKRGEGRRPEVFPASRSRADACAVVAAWWSPSGEVGICRGFGQGGEVRRRGRAGGFPPCAAFSGMSRPSTSRKKALRRDRAGHGSAGRFPGLPVSPEPFDLALAAGIAGSVCPPASAVPACELPRGVGVSVRGVVPQLIQRGASLARRSGSAPCSSMRCRAAARWAAQ